MTGRVPGSCESCPGTCVDYGRGPIRKKTHLWGGPLPPAVVNAGPWTRLTAGPSTRPADLCYGWLATPAASLPVQGLVVHRG